MAVWGPNLALNIAAGSTTELVAICDSGGESRRRARKQHPTVLVIATWQDVLDDDDITAVVIALPRAKHFIVRAGCLLMVGHTFEYNGAVLADSRMLTWGTLEEP